MFPLPQITRPQRPPQITQEATLVGGPGGGHKFTRGGVALKAVDDDAGGNAGKGRAEHVYVFITPEGMIETCGIVAGKRSTLGNIHIVQLETFYG